MKGSESDESFRNALKDEPGLVTDELLIECQFCFSAWLQVEGLEVL